MKSKAIETQQLSDNDLILLAQRNDADAMSEIIHRYSKFAKSISHLYYIPGGEREDLEQEALIGLHEAVQAFKPLLGHSFIDFARLCIKRELITAVKAANRKKHEILNRSISIDGAYSQTDKPKLIDLLPSSNSNPEEIYLHIENEAIIREALYASFSPLQKIVFERRMAGFSYREIANEVGRSIKAIDNAVYRIRLKASIVFSKLYSEDN